MPEKSRFMVQLPVTDLAWLRQKAREHDVPVAVLIRWAITEYRKEADRGVDLSDDLRAVRATYNGRPAPVCPIHHCAYPPDEPDCPRCIKEQKAE